MHVARHGGIFDMRMLINLGDMCNMTCSYCLNSRGGRREQCMDLDTLRAAVSMAHRMIASTVLLYGGEPTVYPYILTAVNELHVKRVMLLTNGLLSSRLVEMADASQSPLTVYVTVHHEYWLAHRDEYARALLEDYKLAWHDRVPWFRLQVLIDVKYMDVTCDIVEWLLTNVDLKHVNVGFVRRSETHEEYVRTYIAAKRRLPAVIVSKLASTHATLPTINPYYGQPCPCFANYVMVNADGSVQSSGCPQPVMAGVITDPAFTLTPCIVTCRQQTVGGFENCRYSRGVASIDDE